MTQETTTQVCEVCQGLGRINNANSSITCTNCQGIGVWLTSEKQTFQFNIPDLVSTSAESESKFQKLLKNFFASAIIAGFLIVFFSLISSGQFSSILWNKGTLNFLFGLLGLGLMWSLTYFNSNQTAELSLHDLDFKTQNIDFAPYANQRVFKTINLAAKLCKNYHTDQVDLFIFLEAILENPRIQLMLARLELPYNSVLSSIQNAITQNNLGAIKAVTISPPVKEIILYGSLEAVGHNFPYIDVEDILLAYLKLTNMEEFFKTIGLTYDEFYAVSRWYAADAEMRRRWAFWLERGRTRPKGYMNRAWTALPTPYLDHYSRDLTVYASMGAVTATPVRTKELSNITEILGSNHPGILIVGEPGIGKMTLLGGLALRMIEDDVPEALRDKRLIQVDIASVLSDTGAAQSNMQAIIDEVITAGNVILAIPDIQFLVGAGSGGSLDAASILYQAMNQGQVQLVSTATHSDYHKYVESNANLSNLLTVIELEEMNIDLTIQVLEQEAPNMESKHKVIITYPAIEACANLAKKYFPDKMLPESAINVLDEACAHVRITKTHLVDEDEVMEVIEKRTNIPVKDATQKEASLLLNLETELHNKVIGQERAVKAVAEALRRARSGLSSGKRPIASFLFVGPTGVGKTETAKALSDLYFRGQSKMIRLDMSEFQDPTAVYKLIGAPATAGQLTEGGALTQPVREQPFSLILLDELEKAYPDVLNLFLQILDDGRATENTGRTVSFNNTIIVATSNAGSRDILELLKQGIAPDQFNESVLRILAEHFKPEFLNRFDGVIPFLPLREEEIFEITKLMLKDVITKVKDRGIVISFADDAIKLLSHEGFDPLYGARPLRRVIQDKVEGWLSKAILSGNLKDGDNIQITAEMLK